MTVTERDKLYEFSAPLDCLGCAERDLEIARLIEQNRQMKSTAIKRLLIVIGWLLMVGVPVFLLSWLGEWLNDGFPFVEFVFSPGLVMSLFLFPIALVPIVLLIHWRTRWQRVFACGLSMTGLLAVWLYFREKLDFFSELTTDFAAVIPICVVFAMLPMLIMKFWKRWKLVSRDHDRIGCDPSISTMLIATALVAASLACFEFPEIETNFDEESSSWQKFQILIYMLGIPAMTVGAFLVVCFYCVLRMAGPRIWALLLVGGIVVSTMVTASTVLLMVYIELGEIEPSREFWLSMVGPGFVNSVICLVLGLLSACFFRLLGYRLRTQDDDDRIRQVMPNEC